MEARETSEVVGHQSPRDTHEYPRIVDGEQAVADFLQRFVTACTRGDIDQSQRLHKPKALLGFATRCVVS